MQFTIYEYLKKRLRADDDAAPNQGALLRDGWRSLPLQITVIT